MSDRVLLAPHDPRFVQLADEVAQQWKTACGDALMAFHHIGSTAVPGLIAKPVLDLLPVFVSLDTLDGLKGTISALGFEWRGEFGLPGRRYCKRAQRDPVVHVHCYATGNPDILRHVAFRDYLRAHPAEASAYADIKTRCAKIHSMHRYAYGDCKSPWIVDAEARALSWMRSKKGDL